MNLDIESAHFHLAIGRRIYLVGLTTTTMALTTDVILMVISSPMLHAKVVTIVTRSPESGS